MRYIPIANLGRIEFDDLHPINHNNFLADMYKKVIFQTYQNREKQIQERLGQLGYTFESNEHWLLFAKERITIVIDNSIPDYRYLYMDYGQTSQLLVAEWWETVEVDYIQSELNVRGIVANITCGRPAKRVI